MQKKAGFSQTVALEACGCGSKMLLEFDIPFRADSSIWLRDRRLRNSLISKTLFLEEAKRKRGR
jgi:hypothetical protein